MEFALKLLIALVGGGPVGVQISVLCLIDALKLTLQGRVSECDNKMLKETIYAKKTSNMQTFFEPGLDDDRAARDIEPDIMQVKIRRASYALRRVFDP